jgi:hypothetical protein
LKVEKSIDGIHFSYIGERPAAGNSNKPLNYTLNDVHPVIGNNYYRLKIIDIDGHFKYSDKILIQVKTVLPVVDAIIMMYPNPTNDKLNVIYQASAFQNIVLNIYNVMGQSLHKDNFEFEAGLHTIVVDAKDYAKGMYIISLENKTRSETHDARFIKE